MGWKYETEIYMHEGNPQWVTAYMGNSLFTAVRTILRLRKDNPGRAYRMIIR